MTPRFVPSSRSLTPVVLLALAAALATVVLAAPAGAVSSQEEDDPSLVQTIPRDQPVVSGSAELTSGHVDLGPRFVDGAWRLLVHDTVTQPPVWRLPDDVVLRVGDADRSSVPISRNDATEVSSQKTNSVSSPSAQTSPSIAPAKHVSSPAIRARSCSAEK